MKNKKVATDAGIGNIDEAVARISNRVTLEKIYAEYERREKAVKDAEVFMELLFNHDQKGG